MNKKIAAVIILSILLLVLGGCSCEHEWLGASCTVPKTCAKCEKTEGEPLGHSWGDASCIFPKTCAICSVSEGESLGHTWSDATCTAPKKCNKCNATDGEELGHETPELTCTNDAECIRCGEIIWAPGHTSESGICDRCGFDASKIASAFVDAVTDWVSKYNDCCDGVWGAEPIDDQNIEANMDDYGIYRYSLSNWVTLVIYPTTECDSIENVSIRFDPAGQRGAWILEVFSLSKLIMEVTYPSDVGAYAGDVVEHYEDTLYSGSWNWPSKESEGLYDRHGIKCDLYRAIDSLIFTVTP